VPLYIELEPTAGPLDSLPRQPVVSCQVSLRVPLGRPRLCTRQVRNKGSDSCSGCILFEHLAHSSHRRLLNTEEDHHVSFDAPKHLVTGGCAHPFFRAPAGLTFPRVWHDHR
jgi:hypothetical protein